MKTTLILIILLVLGGAGYYFYTDKTPSEAPVIDTEVENDGGAGADNESTQTGSEKEFDATGMLEYKNETYGFSFYFPDDWEVQEALKPQDVRALHEISVHETEYEMTRANLSVFIYVNGEGLSVYDWWQAVLAEDDAKKEKCVVEHGDSAPCLYLRDRIELEGEISLAGEDGYTVELFSFDSTRKCDYVRHGEYIVGLCYDGENPNDPNFEAHRHVYQRIVESFSLLMQGTSDEAGDSASVTGMWQSTDDTLAHKHIQNGGVFEEGYDGEVLMTGTWELVEDGETQTLKVVIDDETTEYAVLELTAEALELSLIGRGNTLTYTRVVED